MEDVQPKKVKKRINTSRKPYGEDGITRILHAFKYDTCCPANSRFKHSHYYPFDYSVFSIGVRNVEAIGLKGKSIKFDRQLIEISEVLTQKGSWLY